ncbi:hypothetical protein [Enterococcus ratti]|uniref:hypothetical protein n=1 Tax=Enterococcus ratti TaxID=150033 RepID=UPI00142897EA|nr:hypothetical protein [Enterococcus ratti]
MNKPPRKQSNSVSNQSVLNNGNNNTTSYQIINLNDDKPIASISLIYEGFTRYVKLYQR